MSHKIQDDCITIEFDCQFKVQLKESTISLILVEFADLLPKLLADFCQKVLIGFAEYAMSEMDLLHESD